ncbi:MAG: undecaprenyl-diphosphate phosphatase, partial [Oscillospiraceae bacterium]|nr:undecaprenyl-diphosphate phosphatase [Oscillospiraceae bacterium]
PAIIGIIVAGAVGVGSIIFLRWIVSGNKLHYFRYYCLGMGLVVTILGIIEHARGYAFRF